MQISPEGCTECNRVCQPLTTKHNWSASEWYCSKCHKSYPMDIEAAKQIYAFEANQK
jgi:hypothetical protein